MTVDWLRMQAQALISLNASISRTWLPVLQRSGISRALGMAEALLWQNKKLQKSENKLSKSANNA